MTERRHRLTRLLVAVAMAMFALTLSTGSAQAAPVAAANHCGPGYTLIDQHNTPEAVVHEYYSPAAGKLCAVALIRAPGTPTRVCIGYEERPDCDIYQDHAGPVYANAADCLTLTVIIGDRSYRYPHCP